MGWVEFESNSLMSIAAVVRSWNWTHPAYACAYGRKLAIYLHRTLKDVSVESAFLFAECFCRNLGSVLYERFPGFLNEDIQNTFIKIDQRTRRFPLLTEEDLPELGEFAGWTFALVMLVG